VNPRIQNDEYGAGLSSMAFERYSYGSSRWCPAGCPTLRRLRWVLGLRVFDDMSSRELFHIGLPVDQYSPHFSAHNSQLLLPLPGDCSAILARARGARSASTSWVLTSRLVLEPGRGYSNLVGFSRPVFCSHRSQFVFSSTWAVRIART
jgi:hypothetical protein